MPLRVRPVHALQRAQPHRVARRRPKDLVVVETDGTLQQLDSLKSAHEGVVVTGFTVLDRPLDEVASHLGAPDRQFRLADVSAACRQCPRRPLLRQPLHPPLPIRHGVRQHSVCRTGLEVLVRTLPHP